MPSRPSPRSTYTRRSGRSPSCTVGWSRPRKGSRQKVHVKHEALGGDRPTPELLGTGGAEVARDRLARRTGLRAGPILIYVAVVAVVVAGLLAWDAAWKRREEAARRPPPADVLAKNLVENIIGRNTVKTVTVDEAKGTVDVTFESATYPPAARAAAAGEGLPKQLDRLTPGQRA